MLERLLLMRHAKSSWADPELSDHARPLNKRGRKAADAVAAALVERGAAPDIIWASDARRTQETAERLIHIIPGAQTIIKVPEFYHASPQTVLDICATTSEPDGKLMWLGHNPGWAELYELLSGQAANFPTGACAIFTRVPSGSWLSPAGWTFEALLLPRELMA